MGILFLICSVIFFITLILLPIVDNKRNFLFSSVTSIILLFVINSLIVFSFSLFNISCNLISRSIIFILLSLFNIAYIFKKKKIQNYIIKWYDGLSVVFIVILVLLLGKYRFSPNYDLYFETTDPALHYLQAIDFSNTSKLIEQQEPDFFYKSDGSSTMFLGYVSLGTIFQIESSFGGNHTTFVFTFIVFELCKLALTGIALYSVVTKLSNIDKKGFLNYILINILVLLFLAGYPFNEIIFGYHYLGIGILLIMVVLGLFEDIINDNKNVFLLLLFSLIIFSVFSSYYLFVPIVYGGCGLAILYETFIKKKIVLKDAIRLIVLILVIPFIFGILYYFVRNSLIINSNNGDISAFKSEGYIYRNLLGNFILLLIGCTYKFIVDIKDKKIDVFDLSLIMNLLFTIILFIPFYQGTHASYYYYKMYYILWPLCFIVIGKGLCCKVRELSSLNKVLIIFMTIAFSMEILDVEENLKEKNILLNPTNSIQAISDIYFFNQLKINREFTKPIYTKDELNSLVNLIDNNNIDGKKNLIFYGNLLQRLWFYDLSKLNPNNGKDNLNSFYEENITYENLYKEDCDVEYIVCFYKNCFDISSDYYDFEYKNENFGLLKRKSPEEINDIIKRKQKKKKNNRNSSS